MIRNYIAMKRNEWKVKAMLYGAAAYIIENNKDFISIIQKLYEAMKDVPVAEFRSELVSKMAEIVHSENQENKTE